jgi:membrane protein DedA with SNARE-associated domain
MHRLLAILTSWGPAGLLALATIESAGIPNPGGTDALLLVLTIARPSDEWLCAAMAVLGSLIGTFIFFELTRKGGERYLARYMSSGRGSRFRAWFQRYGLVTVFIPALLPIPFLPFKAFVACAGATSCKRPRFFLVLLAGRIPRYFALAYLGAHLGKDSWPWVQAHFWPMALFALILSIFLYGLIRWSDRKQLQWG